MTAALFMAGFQVWDVTMSDLCANAVDLAQFRGLVFVGGFSYADVCGSAKVGNGLSCAHVLVTWGLLGLGWHCSLQLGRAQTAGSFQGS
jgi:hypothetical protein